MLCEFYANKAPEDIGEAELEAYFLRRRNVDHWSANTLRICYCGIRFYFVKVLQRDWNLFNFLRAKSESRLPAVLSQEEVRALLGCVRTPHNRAYLTTVYACGLRLQEALYLEVSDIDADRMMIHVHRGKGAKDRFVPLPKKTLDTLREHWRSHRHQRLLFPAYGRDSRSAGSATQPMAISSVQGAFRSAKEQAGITKKAVSVHTLQTQLCHAYAGDRRQPAHHSAVSGAHQPGDDHGLSASDPQGTGRCGRARQYPHGGAVTWAPFRRSSVATDRRIGREFGETMPSSHQRVIEAIIDCRSAACGSVLYQCEDCGEPHVAPRCCGNRHCPVCQQGKAEQWLCRQLERQLATPYFMLTFTVPAGLREFLRRHPREGYGALFAASAGAIKTLAADDKHLGADTPGFFGVLHTSRPATPVPPPYPLRGARRRLR